MRRDRTRSLGKHGEPLRLGSGGNFDLEQAESVIEALISEMKGAIDGAEIAASDCSDIEREIEFLAMSAVKLKKNIDKAKLESLREKREMAKAVWRQRAAEVEELRLRLKQGVSAIQEHLKKLSGNLEKMRSGKSRLRENAVREFEKAEPVLVREISRCEGLIRKACETDKVAASQRTPPAPSRRPTRDTASERASGERGAMGGAAARSHRSRFEEQEARLEARRRRRGTL
jgi:hypothetical protein